MRRLPLLVAGVLLAGLAGTLALIAALAVEAVQAAPEEGLALVHLAAWVGVALGADPTGALALAALHAAWVGVVLICFLPVGLAAVVGEWAGWRGWLWYTAVAGVLASAGPFLLWVGPGETSSAMAAHLLLLAFLNGTGTGAVYWLCAGRSAGASEQH